MLQPIDDCNNANVSVYSFTLKVIAASSFEDWYHPAPGTQTAGQSTDHIRNVAE